MECDLSTDDLLDEHLGLNDDVTLLFSPDTCDSDGSLGSSEHVSSLCGWEGAQTGLYRMGPEKNSGRFLRSTDESINTPSFALFSALLTVSTKEETIDRS
jgi:hypothetical protein